MTDAPRQGDQARASVHVRVPVDVAFRVFTEDIDRWWRRGLKYRVAGARRGFLHLEPRASGRIFESFETDSGPKVFETGTISTWAPPSRLVFEWRTSNFGPGETTEVEVIFEATATGTLVTITHRGWAQIRQDHPVRHGKDVAAFLRMSGLWWGDLLSSLREFATAGRADAATSHRSEG